jgi:glycosyltransferase involved in cell wall biosynthesis
MPNTDFQPLVSIVIPVYNGGNYMREAIDSALAQTYPNIEVIVVNDGSRDEGETDAIARSYGDRIRYFHKENGGCASALNRGIEEMRGAYFSWLSHDDVYLPEKVEHQIAVLAGLEDKNTILYGGWEIIDAESKPMTTVHPHAAQPAEKLDIALFPLLRGLLHGCSMLVPVRYFREIGVFDINLPSTQDYALWFRFLRVAPIHYDPRVLICSRVHPEQGTHKIARHIEECNDLWSGFLTQLTEAEMSTMEGSPYRFLINTARFLANTPYQEARKLAESMAPASLENTPISVVIPFHNRLDWTIEAVRSAQAQTHQRLEILLVDDGSTDDLAPLQTVIQGDSRIVYLRQEQAGPAKARNAGMARAQGAYVAFLDSDDLFRPDKLSRQLAYMEENGLAFSHTSYERMDEQGQTLDQRDSGKFAGIVFPDIISGCPIAMPTVMVRTDVLRSHRFPEGFDVGEDICLWIQLAREHELGGMDEPLSRVRVGPDSAALHQLKQARGLINIASFVVHDPELSLHGKSLRKVLRHAWSQVPNESGPPPEITSCLQLNQPPPLWKRAYRQLRQHGVRATYRRIRFLLDR